MPLPDVSAAFFGLTTPVKFTVLVKGIQDHQGVERKTPPVTFLAVLQPMASQKVRVKPEGQRVFKWWSMWSKKELATDTVIQDHRGKQFRVDEVKDWNMAGFMEYELVENVKL